MSRLGPELSAPSPFLAPGFEPEGPVASAPETRSASAWVDPQFVAVEPDRERPVVHQLDLHVGPEAALPDRDPVAARISQKTS